MDEVKALGKDFTGWTSGMFVCRGDDRIAARFFAGHGYESVTRELWRRCCKNAPIVVDVGTHSGVFTLDAYRAGARIVLSVEPHPINFARMVMNLRHNGFPQFGAYLGAAGDVTKTSMFNARTLHAVHAAGQVGVEGKGEHIPVRVVRLDELIGPSKWPNIKAVKIDAENYTPAAIEGMSKLFDAGHFPDLFIECIQGGMGDRLKSLGYKFWTIWETGKVEPVDDLLPHNPENNYNGTHEDCRNRFASVRGLPES